VALSKQFATMIIPHNQVFNKLRIIKYNSRIRERVVSTSALRPPVINILTREGSSITKSKRQPGVHCADLRSRGGCNLYERDDSVYTWQWKRQKGGGKEQRGGGEGSWSGCDAITAQTHCFISEDKGNLE